jgi:hypothetical protein
LEKNSYQSKIADNFTVESAEGEMFANVGARRELVAEEDRRGSCEELRGQMLLQVLFLTSRCFRFLFFSRQFKITFTKK